MPLVFRYYFFTLLPLKLQLILPSRPKPNHNFPHGYKYTLACSGNHPNLVYRLFLRVPQLKGLPELLAGESVKTIAGVGYRHFPFVHDSLLSINTISYFLFAFGAVLLESLENGSGLRYHSSRITDISR
jgi:hypothetical protein